MIRLATGAAAPTVLVDDPATTNDNAVRAPLPVGAAGPPGHGATDPLFFAALTGARSVLAARALFLTGDPAEAADLVQDTMVRALERRTDRVPSDKMVNWLLVILRNLFLDRWRARAFRSRFEARGEELEELPAPEPSERPAWACYSRAELDAAVAALSPRLREVYQACEIQGLSYKAAGARFGLGKNTVATRLLRARRRLRALLVTGEATARVIQFPAPTAALLD